MGLMVAYTVQKKRLVNLKEWQQKLSKINESRYSGFRSGMDMEAPEEKSLCEGRKRQN